jgi:hypothetical protein
MNKWVNSLGHLLLSLCLLLAMSDFFCVDPAHSHHPVTVPVSCTDIAGMAEESHGNCNGDEVVSNMPIRKYGFFADVCTWLTGQTDLITDQINSGVWQPPRLS